MRLLLLLLTSPVWSQTTSQPQFSLTGQDYTKEYSFINQMLTNVQGDFSKISPQSCNSGQTMARDSLGNVSCTPTISTVTTSGTYPSSNLNEVVLTIGASGQITNIKQQAIGAVDPPGLWTCTLRTTASAAIANTVFVSATATCSGTEKAVSGGCTMTGGSSASGNTTMLAGGPTNQGWTCDVIVGGTNGTWTVTATANCCL